MAVGTGSSGKGTAKNDQHSARPSLTKLGDHSSSGGGTRKNSDREVGPRTMPSTLKSGTDASGTTNLSKSVSPDREAGKHNPREQVG